MEEILMGTWFKPQHGGSRWLYGDTISYEGMVGGRVKFLFSSKGAFHKGGKAAQAELMDVPTFKANFTFMTPQERDEAMHNG